MSSIDNLKKDLHNNANTLQDVLDIIPKHFDTTSKLGSIAKSLLIANMNKIILTSGAKPKK